MFCRVYVLTHLELNLFLHTKFNIKLEIRFQKGYDLEDTPPSVPHFISNVSVFEMGRRQKAIYRLMLRQKTLHQKIVFRFGTVQRR